MLKGQVGGAINTLMATPRIFESGWFFVTYAMCDLKKCGFVRF